jgi:hypothetical protein
MNVRIIKAHRGAMQRVKAKHLALQAQFDAGSTKRTPRKKIKKWLDPIRNAVKPLRTGEIDAYRGYAVTRIPHVDNNLARVDFVINGFTGMLDRVAPTICTKHLKTVSKKLAAGVMLAPVEVESCFVELNACEDLLCKLSPSALKDAAHTEMIAIEFSRIGVIE